ncbi:MAG: histidine phosphatase family protein [Ignavibacteriaceae bacterium]
MNLYLIRHSTSENSSFNKKDFERELTEEGINLIKNSVAAWKKFIYEFEIIFTSPLKRAVQTSEIISNVMQPVPNIIVENNLGTGSRTQDLIEILNGTDKKEVAVIGHQPDLSIHIYNLCGSGNFNLVFPPAAIAKIEFENRIKYGSGKLIFFAPPFLYK